MPSTESAVDIAKSELRTHLQNIERWDKDCDLKCVAFAQLLARAGIPPNQIEEELVSIGLMPSDARQIALVPSVGESPGESPAEKHDSDDGLSAQELVTIESADSKRPTIPSHVNYSGPALFRSSSRPVLCGSLFAVGFGTFMCVASTVVSSDLAAAAALAGIGVVVIGLAGLIISAAKWTSGLKISVDADRICWEGRGLKKAAALDEAKWDYVPYIGASGPLGRLWRGLVSIRSGLFLKWNDGTVLRITPGVFKKSDARGLIVYLSQYVGPVPRFMVHGRIIEADRVRLLGVASCPKGGKVLLTVHASVPAVVEIEMDESQTAIIVRNMSRRAQVKHNFDFIFGFRDQIAPENEAVLTLVNFSPF